MKIVVIGGGIAGVSCVNEILKLEKSPDLRILMISASNFVKTVENYRKIGQFGEQFDVRESKSTQIFADSRFQFLKGTVTKWAVETKEIHVDSQFSPVKYDKLCISTGSRPRFQSEFSSDPRFLFLRDTESAAHLEGRLRTANEVLIVGNGGIATELIFELPGIQMTWMMRDSWICASFFPEDVAGFIEKRLLKGRGDGRKNEGIQKRSQFILEDSGAPIRNSEVPGPALGPDWCSALDFNGKSAGNREIRILKNCVMARVEEGFVEYEEKETGKKSRLHPDLIICATGVVPNSDPWIPHLNSSSSGAILINDACETSHPDVFACGDVCSLPEPSPLWSQRQLWTQARQLGEVCGRSMVAGAEEARMQNIYFELFSHCTTFFGMKVVFLGDYKPEKQEIGAWKVVLRETEEEKLIRCVVVGNVIVGALLIGETEMEETLENLILNKTDLQGISETFLEPGVDLDDYFD